MIEKLRATTFKFPAGRVGLGLLLLRLAIGITMLTQGALSLLNQDNYRIWEHLYAGAVVVLGVITLIGLFSPILTTIVLLGTLFFIVSNAHAIYTTLPAVYLAIISAASTLLGPGAYSADAKLFGRREIIIPNRTSKS
jgi:hypothetical protein